MIFPLLLGSSALVDAFSSVVVEATAVVSAAGASSLVSSVLLVCESFKAGGTHGFVTHGIEASDSPAAESIAMDATIPPRKIALGKIALTDSIMFNEVLLLAYFETRCPDFGTLVT